MLKARSTILKMNFNFNLKDMPPAPEASIRRVTTPRDLHHMAKSGIKRGNIWLERLRKDQMPCLKGCGEPRRSRIGKGTTSVVPLSRSKDEPRFSA
jgi:hypothetical protein